MSNGLEADKKRQATSSIRGYVYQAYQSILAWVRLGPDETLYLEGAEDFDIHATEEVIATQIKDKQASGKFTLKSKDAVDALNHFWEHQERNPDKRIKFRFMTTADSGVERGVDFSPYANGTEFWIVCNRNDSVDLSPLRHFLQKLDLSKPLSQFIRFASDGELRERLVSRIDWDTGRRPIDGLIEDIYNHLTFLGVQFGVNSHQAKKVFGALLHKVMELLSSEGERRLLYTDFVQVFEQATMELVSKEDAATIKSFGQAPQNQMLVDLASAPRVLGEPMPLLQGAVNRNKLVEELTSVVARHGVLILRGGTGLGKTSLARLLTDNIGGEWVWAGFRGRDAVQTCDQLNRAAFEIKAHQLPLQVVLDDLDLSRTHEFERELLALVFSVSNAGGKVIITSQTACPIDILGKLWIETVCDRDVPYFDVEDVYGLLITHGLQDTEKIAEWGQIIRALTGGHPQLVHARIRYLQARNWPEFDHNDLVKEPSDIDEVKTNARKRLLDTFPNESARVLAFRLSLTTGPFARQLAIDLGSVPPPALLPGEAFDSLVGPWIEDIGPAGYRVSPLLSNAGMSVFSEQEQTAVHEAIANSFIKARSISPHDLGTALFHAIISKSDWSVLFLSKAVLECDQETTRAISDSTIWLSAFGLEKGQKILDNVASEIFFRLAQFQIAVAGKRTSVSLKMIDQVQWLIDQIDDNKVRNMTEVMAYTVFLNTVDVPVPPKQSMRMLVRLMDEAQSDEALNVLADAFKEKNFEIDRISGLSPFQLLFTFEIIRLTGIEYLSELLDALNELDAKTRQELVDVLENDADDIAFRLTGNAWWRDVTNECLEIEKAFEIYEKTISLAQAWDSPRLEKGAYIAISVLHDEYGDDPEKALEVLDRAEALYPGGDSYLLNQRAKVHFHKKDYGTAISVFEDALSRPGLDQIERAFAGRSGGMAAGRLNDWAKAEKLFALGARAAAKTSYATMEIGLLADTAFAKWKQDQKREALGLFATVLERLEEISETGDLRDRHLHAAVRHVIGWLNIRGNKGPNDEFPEPSPGLCSTQEPNEKISEQKLIRLPVVWGLLSAIDKRCGTKLGLSERAEKKLDGKPPLNIQFAEVLAQYEGIWEGVNTEDAVCVILSMTEASEHFKSQDRSSDAGWDSGNISPLPTGYWNDEKRRENFLFSLISASVVILNSSTGGKLPVEKWRADCAEQGVQGEDIDSFFSLLSGIVSDTDSGLIQECARSLCEIDQGTPFPDDLFIFHFRLLNALYGGSWTNGISQALDAIVVAGWRYVVGHQRFALRAPGLAAKTINETCDDSTLEGFPKVAAVLLSASDAVTTNLAQSGMKFLRDIRSGKKLN